MNFRKIKLGVLGLGLLTNIQCTSNFEDINTNPTGTKDYPLNAAFATMFNNILVLSNDPDYQLQQGLQGDIWSGYMATPFPFRGGVNNTTYSLVDTWNATSWKYAYIKEMYFASYIASKTKSVPEQLYAYAISLILKVEAMHRLTDTYGPIIYSQYGNTSSIIPYDSQEEVYNQMFSELEIAANELTKKVDANETKPTDFTDNSSYDGNYKQWIKLANSLRLRLAMRIVKANPELAKKQAEAAVSQKYGVMTTNEDNFVINSVFNHPIAKISNSWKDIKMSADMESIMGGYEDPRLAVYFNYSTLKDFTSDYKGVRTGVDLGQKEYHTSFSSIGKIINTNKIVLMTAAEVYFLKAEGALRNWNMGGTAQEFYEQGIKTSFEQHGIAQESMAYITNNTKTAKDYADPVLLKDKDGKIVYDGSMNNAVAVNNVSVAWNEAAANEVKLQKIITQKWIAGFPEGQEAWSEYRRTGYPKLFPVIKNYSGGTIDSNLGVRRVNFVQNEKDTNPQGLATGISKLNGSDTGGTRLWWDTTNANF